MAKRPRYADLEHAMTVLLFASLADFILFLIFAGLGVIWLKVITAIFSPSAQPVDDNGLCGHFPLYRGFSHCQLSQSRDLTQKFYPSLSGGIFYLMLDMVYALLSTEPSIYAAVSLIL